MKEVKENVSWKYRSLIKNCIVYKKGQQDAEKVHRTSLPVTVRFRKKKFWLLKAITLGRSQLAIGVITLKCTDRIKLSPECSLPLVSLFLGSFIDFFFKRAFNTY